EPKLDFLNESQNKYEIENKIGSYFYQIHQTNINTIFDSAVIAPRSYFNDEKTSDDIQDINSDWILLYDNSCVFKEEKDQILIEVIIFSDQKLLPTNIKNTYVTDMIIPISRIKSIIYTDQNYFTKLEKLVQSNALSFVPFCISKRVAKFNLIKSNNKFEKIKVKNTDYREQLNLFNKLLGMFAFMKNADLYYGKFSNYCIDYLEALSVINNKIFKTYGNLKTVNFFDKIINQFSAKQLYKDIIENRSIDKKYLDNFIKEHYEKDHIAYKELINLESKPFSISKNSYLKILTNYKFYQFVYVAYIAIYGDKSRSSTSSIQLKNDFSNEIKNPEESSKVLALLGLYYGYQFIRSQDNISFSEKNELTQIIDPNTNIKYQMDSQLDYLTVESVFSKSFKTHIVDFEIIKGIAPKYKENTKLNKELKRLQSNQNLDIETFSVLDVTIYKVEKKNLKKKAIALIEQNYPEIIRPKYFIFCWVSNFFSDKELIIYNEELYLRKTSLLKMVGENEFDENFLLEVLNLDNKLILK
ncbi:MAG: hypothetical protein PHE33_07590, partial [Bacteroidales bacterium]|nr:hypothetical protein [Bacteroidales bacterium]